MSVPPFFRSIRARLAVLILVAMTALVGYLVYEEVQGRSAREERGEENLRSLATFAAHAERERFDSIRRLLELATRSGGSLLTAAKTPDSVEAHDACTRGLYILDQLYVGTRFSLWDTSGKSICSSRAAQYGEFNAAGTLWFQTTVERQDYATGEFELAPPDDQPSLSFGVPIRDESGVVVAYLSTAVSLEEPNALLRGQNLPDTGRVSVVDQDGVVLGSTSRAAGERLTLYPDSFKALAKSLDSVVERGDNRTGAAVRITDQGDAAVTAVVSAENDAIAPPLTETLIDDLLPVAILAAITLLATWLLGERWVVRPVEALARASKALASGNLSARARVTGGVTEFEQLEREFNQMAETRERATHAKDEFLGLVSHELKTPITIVLGNAEVLQRRDDALDADMRRLAAEDIHESAVRLDAIIENLLSLARLDRGIGLEREPIPLLRIARVTADDLEVRSGGREISVVGDRNVLALGGPTQVRQVIENLVANAIKYSPDDGPIEVTIEQRSNMAVMRVLDRGSGIDPREAESVFEPFYRSARTADAAEGVGIGLSVCKRLIESMGGRIWCASREGGGCEFGFMLPVATEEEEPVVEEVIAATAEAIPAESQRPLIETATYASGDGNGVASITSAPPEEQAATPGAG